MVCGLLFLRPAMRCLCGLEPDEGLGFSATLGRDLGANDRREDYLRSRLERDADGSWIATPFERQDSAMMTILAAADCLVIRPPLAPPARRGDRVDVLGFPGSPPAL